MIIWIFFVFSSAHAQNEKTVHANVDQEFAAAILSVLILVETEYNLSGWEFRILTENYINVA